MALQMVALTAVSMAVLRAELWGQQMVAQRAAKRASSPVAMWVQSMAEHLVVVMD